MLEAMIVAVPNRRTNHEKNSEADEPENKVPKAFVHQESSDVGNTR